MAQYINEPSRTFNEYLLVPGYTSKECRVENVSLKTPVVKFKKGEEPALSANIPLVSAVMQAVSNDTMAVALAKGETVDHEVIIPTTIVDRDNYQEFLDPTSPY